MLRRAALVVVVVAGLALASCGGEDNTFDAEGFVQAMNDQGAELVLGDSLPNTQEGVEVYGVELHEEEGETAPAEEEGHTHGGGSLTIAEDEAAGVAEYERCESAVTLLCFRAQNAVLILEQDVPTEERTAIETAIRGLAEED